jgi:hypothetical protein
MIDELKVASQESSEFGQSIYRLTVQHDAYFNPYAASLQVDDASDCLVERPLCLDYEVVPVGDVRVNRDADHEVGMSNIGNFPAHGEVIEQSAVREHMQCRLRQAFLALLNYLQEAIAKQSRLAARYAKLGRRDIHQRDCF